MGCLQFSDLSRKQTPCKSENPEWTKEDFGKARLASELPSESLDAFPRTSGPQKAAKKVAISVRLNPEVVAHFKASGPGWQARIDEALKRALGL